MMKDLTKKQTQHDDVLELLPWFVNSSLEGKERIKVMTHLGECVVCQQERDRLQQLQALVQSQEPDFSKENYKPAFDKLMDRIDASEESKSVASQVEQVARRPAWLPYAAAATLFVGIALVMFVNRPAPVETLSIPAVPGPTTAISSSQRLALTFESNINSETLRSAFVETGAYIVSGPDADGRYVVDVVRSDDQSGDELVRSILAVPGVKYAQLLE